MAGEHIFPARHSVARRHSSRRLPVVTEGQVIGADGKVNAGLALRPNGRLHGGTGTVSQAAVLRRATWVTARQYPYARRNSTSNPVT